ncbi:MAG: coiled-coil domain-containing protein, partial [Lachnospiraceae bacterium]
MRKRIIALLLAGVLAASGRTAAFAASTDGVREAGEAAAAAAGAAFDNTEYANARSEAEAEKNAAEARLAEAEASLRSLEEKQRQVAGEIDEKNASLVDLLVSISQTNDEIAEADQKVAASEKTIASTQKKLTNAESERDAQYRAMKRRIQYFYENAYPLGLFGILLDGGSGSWLDRMDQLLSLEETDRDAYKAYQKSVQEILLLKEKLGEEKKVLVFEKKTLEAREASLEAQKTELSDQIEALKSSDADYESRIAQVEEQAKVITDLIQVQSQRLKEIEAAEAETAE